MSEHPAAVKKILTGCGLAALAGILYCGAARAQSRLLYLEAQAVAGYSPNTGKIVYYSMNENDAMQRPSLGADFVGKLSGGNGDWGTLALQPRIAWNGGPQFQLYNGYLRARTPFCYLWAGHNRTAVGLESYFDTHGALLQTLPMYGFGFDRDWGIGASRDFGWGGAAFSATTGSGMPFYMKDSYLVSARVSLGALGRDNYNAGVYFSGGRTPDITGYHASDLTPMPYGFLGADFAYLVDNFDFRADLRKGEKQGRAAYAALGRIGAGFAEEGRLKLELQPVFYLSGGESGCDIAAGASYAVSPELTLRSLYERSTMPDDSRLTFQMYYYVKI
ncbi:MAG: hypothetical protein WC421_08015 [Elusimicrobiales bacterium]